VREKGIEISVRDRCAADGDVERKREHGDDDHFAPRLAEPAFLRHQRIVISEDILTWRSPMRRLPKAVPVGELSTHRRPWVFPKADESG
jgi:hypothetical protein